MKWNKVNEVPPPFECVLAYCPLYIDGLGEPWGNCVVLAECVYYDKSRSMWKNVWKKDDGIELALPVSHWMPLPSAPEDDSE